MEVVRAPAEPVRAGPHVRIDEFRNVVSHDAADAKVIVAEHDLVGTVTTARRKASAGVVVVVRFRHGNIVPWRKYQANIAIGAALAGR